MSNAIRKYSRGIKNKLFEKYTASKAEAKKTVMSDLLKMKFSEKLLFCFALLAKKRIK